MKDHHSMSSSTNQLAHPTCVQWRGEAQPSHFQISNFEIVLNVVRLKSQVVPLSRLYLVSPLMADMLMGI
jgi:hypothetical protein